VLYLFQCKSIYQCFPSVYSDIRAKLEISITHVIDLRKRQEEMVVEESDYTSDSEDVSCLLLADESIRLYQLVISLVTLCMCYWCNIVKKQFDFCCLIIRLLPVCVCVCV